AAVRRRRAVGRGEVRRGVEDAPLAGEEVAARGLAEPGAEQPQVAAVEIHAEDLVAAQVGARRLEDDAVVLEGEVGLRVGPAEGELAHVAQPALLRVRRDRGGRALLVLRERGSRRRLLGREELLQRTRPERALAARARAARGHDEAGDDGGESTQGVPLLGT